MNQRLALLTIIGGFLALYELFYYMRLNFFAYNILKTYGLEIDVLWRGLDPHQSLAILLATAVITAVIMRPSHFLGKFSPLYDLLIILLGLVGFLYLVVNYDEIVKYGFVRPTTERVVVPLLALVALIDASRRILGPILPLLSLGALAFTFYHENYSVAKMINHFYYTTEGAFGIPMRVMASYVFAFLLFGSFILSLGVGKYITELLLAAFGTRVKGVAKLAVVSSMFTGTLTGSSVANVMITGTYTIPLSKRAGYPPHVAGAAEAAASTGGQLMPPILGAAAFVMAEFLGRPYRDIVIAAFLPALLYFFSIYMFIDRYSKRNGLVSVDPTGMPSLSSQLPRIYLLFPMLAVAILLLYGLEPQYAAVGSLGFLILIVSLSMGGALERVFMSLAALALGALAWSASLMPGPSLFFIGASLFVITMALSLIPTWRRSSEVREALGSTAEGAATVFLAAALAGVIQGSLTLTGLASVIGAQALALAKGNVILVAVIIMLISLVLGMGVPTTANYIITSTIGAAALALAIHQYSGVELKAAMLAAHFFVFYFGILADLTPPVALASYAAATVAKADFWKTAIAAAKMASAGYLVPFVLIMNPSLLLVTLNPSLESLFALFTGFAGAVMTVLALSSGIEGWLRGPLGLPERVLLVILGIANLAQSPLLLSALILIVSIAVYALLYIRSGRTNRAL